MAGRRAERASAAKDQLQQCNWRMKRHGLSAFGG